MLGDVSEYLVETKDLTKRYGDRFALNGVRLTVRAGEIYGFLGPNGAGKTTTLRILLGLARPTSGYVRVLGRPPGEPAALARIGMLIETAAFYPYLSGRDNLRALARYSSVPDARVDEVLETVQLRSAASAKFSTYSLGMKQRLGLAGALLKSPELLILDEPTNGLDPAGMADIRQLIRQLSHDGHTILLSSHMLAEVEQTCDRAAMIVNGKVVREGTVTELRGAAVLTVGAEPLDEARRLAERVLGPEAVDLHAGELTLRAQPEDAVRVNREMVMAGIAVSKLSWAGRSLEDIFFEVTATAPDERPIGEEQHA